MLPAAAQSLLAGALHEIGDRGITPIGLSLSQVCRADDLQPDLTIDWVRLDVGLAHHLGVDVAGGDRVGAVMPNGPSSIATVRVRPSMPAFAAE